MTRTYSHDSPPTSEMESANKMAPKTAKSVWLTLLDGSVWIYITFITLWFCLRLAYFDSIWWLALLNSLALYLFFPLALWLPLVLLCRRWKLLLGLAIPTALFVALFGKLLFPPQISTAQVSDSQKADRILTIVSFNILWHNLDFDAIATAATASNPDIIGVQEIHPDNIAALTAAFPDYPFTGFHPVDRSHTVGVLSKWPITSSESYPNPPIQRGFETTIEIDGTPISFIVSHLAPNNMSLWPPDVLRAETIERFSRRAAEVEVLQQQILDSNLPSVMVCDCNMTSTSETYAQMATVLSDSFVEAGWGLGRTLRPEKAPFPLQRIDYVWHSDDFQAVEAYVGQDGGSDHRPIVAKLQLGH